MAIGGALSRSAASKRSDMPIKNYTTSVPANRSIQEIQETLVKHGATDVLLKYELGTGRIEALKFVVRMVDDRRIPFQLPVDWRAFQAVLKEQRVSKFRDEDYCYRVAWRVVRDWVMAQMALYETQMVTVTQIFLPYAVTKTGETLYERAMLSQNLLSDGGENSI